MCGRFTLFATPDELISFLDITSHIPNILPRYNIAPSQDILAVISTEEGEDDKDANIAELFHWGLVPSWMKDRKKIKAPINARIESVLEKPMFKAPFKRKRCIIPASGFYEWKKTDEGKTPWYMHPKEDPIFRFAGMWDEWLDKDTGEILRSCTILTGSPNELIEPIHNRMPVILDNSTATAWLDPKSDPDKLHKTLLLPFPPDNMKAHPVSKKVNNARTDEPDCVDPIVNEQE